MRLTTAMQDTIEFHDWLKEALSRPGRSQAGLARALGLDTSAVNRLANGKRQLRLKEISPLADYILRHTGGTQEETDYLTRLYWQTEDLYSNAFQERVNLVKLMREGGRASLLLSGFAVVRPALEMAVKRAVAKDGPTFSDTLMAFPGNDLIEACAFTLNRMGLVGDIERDEIVLLRRISLEVEENRFETAILAYEDFVSLRHPQSEPSLEGPGAGLLYNILCTQLASYLRTGSHDAFEAHLKSVIEKQEQEDAAPSKTTRDAT